MEKKTLNPLSIVSLVAGILAILGHGCCCIPLIGVLFGLLVVLLEVVAIVTGVIANAQKEEGQSEPLAIAGIATGAVAALMSIVFFVLSFGFGLLNVAMS